MSDNKISPKLSPKATKLVTVRTDLEVSPDRTNDDKSPRSDVDLSNLNKVESILRCSIKGLYIKIKDLIFMTNMINNRHMRLITPLVLKITHLMSVPDEMCDLLLESKMSFQMGFEIIPLISLYESSMLSIEQAVEVRQVIKNVESRINAEALSDKDELKVLLRRLNEEAEKRVLTNLYEVAKFLTVNKIDRRDMIMKLVDIIMKILGEPIQV